ncbi:MAG: hypothetical protein AABY53_04430 [Bdellovibrionota bacterium]
MSMKTYALLIIPFLFITSCKKKQEGNNCVGAPESAIEGVWQTQCLSSSSTSYQTSVTVLCSTLSWQTSFFSATGCVESSKTRILTNSGGFFTTIGASSSVSGATEVDISNGTIELMPVTSAEASAMNASSYCGMSNWTVNVKQSVSGYCGLDFYGYHGAKSFSVYQVVSTLLYFGTSSASFDGTSAAKRFNTLGSLGYVKSQ